MAKVIFNENSTKYLHQNGIFIRQFKNTLSMNLHVKIEPPVYIDAEIAFSRPFEIGAFSHLNGGFIKDARIGRYCSFARNVKIGHGSHPTDWLSVSPLQYGFNYRNWIEVADNISGRTPRMSNAKQRFEHSRTTIIGHDVWIGVGAYIKDGLTIGNGAIIGANSVVTKDVPDYAIVAGNPAKILRMRFNDTIVERLLRIKFWNYIIEDFEPINFSNIHQALDRIEALVGAGKLNHYTPPYIDTNTIMEKSRS